MGMSFVNIQQEEINEPELVEELSFLINSYTCNCWFVFLCVYELQVCPMVKSM